MATGVEAPARQPRPNDPAPPYAELVATSNFTFLEGASHPEELVERAAQLGYAALALTDEASLAGAVRAHQSARAQGLKLILGARFRLTPETDRASDPRGATPSPQPPQNTRRPTGATTQAAHARDATSRWTLVILVRDGRGYAALCRLITQARRHARKGGYRLTRHDFEQALADAGPHAWALLVMPPEDAAPPFVVDPLAELLARIDAVGCEQTAIAVAFERTQRDVLRADRAMRLVAQSGWPIVAVGDVRYHVRGRRALHDVLRAIRARQPLHAVAGQLAANGERHLRPRDDLAALYPEAWRAQSLAIADACCFCLDELRYPYPQDAVTPHADARTALAVAVAEGLRWRWPEGAPAAVREQIERELALIHELGYEPYFLTVYDIVREARRRGILCQGRGSAANSAVCYVLGITAVDPARAHMLFERFISRERNEPPDIDVDFEHERREEIFQYIWARYGRDRAALAAAVIRYRRRSALRDVGRALGLPKARLDALTANLAWWDDGIPRERLADVGIDPDGALARQWHRLASDLVGFPRHLSQHTGGFVIAAGRLDELVPIENAAMPARTVIQWDKDDLDAAGLMKIDLLALGMLSALRRALDGLAALTGRAVDLADIPAEDPAVYRALGQGDAIGVFQIESRAQLAMLPRLKPQRFYDLVIEIAIVRPGPIQGEMVHPYLRRRQGLEPVTYPSAAVRRVLERTLGVPIFQEQIIELAMVAAGFSAGEADGLRRAIGSWRKQGLLQTYRERLLAGLRQHGYPERFAEQIYQQILGFGEYGFPESHAASFALLTYVSAWFKVHHPAIYLCALLNSQPMGFYAPWQLIQDARRHGVDVRPVDIVASDWDCRLEVAPSDTASTDAAPAVRLGFRLVRGLARTRIERLIASRRVTPLRDLADLRERRLLNTADLERLAAAGAFARWHADRHAGLWAVQDALPDTELWSAHRRVTPDVGQDRRPADPSPAPIPPCDTFDQLALDLGTTGLTLGPHPLAWLRPRLPPARPPYLDGRALAARPNPRVRTLGLVIARQRPESAHGTVFLSLEDETGTINVVVWPDRVERHRRAILHGRLVEVLGRAETVAGVTHVVAERLIERNAWLAGLDLRTRAFG